jgi:RNA polymerase sigma-70 factor, ECF subfamily
LGLSLTVAGFGLSFRVKERLSQQEFGLMVSRHQSGIYAYILTIMPDRFAAQDVLQETVLLMWKKLDDFEKGTHFAAWAYRIAYWQTKAYLKKRSGRDWSRSSPKSWIC